MRFFKCQKCGFQFVSSRSVPSSLICGAMVGFKINESGEEIPMGCSGEIKEISYEECTRDIS